MHFISMETKLPSLVIIFMTPLQKANAHSAKWPSVLGLCIALSMGYVLSPLIACKKLQEKTLNHWIMADRAGYLYRWFFNLSGLIPRSMVAVLHSLARPYGQRTVFLNEEGAMLDENVLCKQRTTSLALEVLSIKFYFILDGHLKKRM